MNLERRSFNPQLGLVVFACSGKVTLADEAAVNAAFNEVFEGARFFVFDMMEAPKLVSSDAVGALARGCVNMRTSRNGGDVLLVCPPSGVARHLERMNLSGMMRTFSSVAQATMAVEAIGVSE